MKIPNPTQPNPNPTLTLTQPYPNPNPTLTIQYYNQLLQDMKIPHRRKGINVVAEVLMPYQAGDYDGIVNQTRASSH